MEYKFRAWHKGYASVGYKFEPQMLSEKNAGDVFRWLHEGQPIEIMQYTGLKDKNGVEIYEGDILEIKVHMMSGYDYQGNDIYEVETEYQKVVFENGCFGVKLNAWSCDHINWSEFNTDDSVEVIGNKFEHPELLSGKAITENDKKHD